MNDYRSPARYVKYLLLISSVLAISACTPATSNVESSPTEFDSQQTAISLELVVDGLDRPVFVTHAGDDSGRLFIVEKGGTVRTLHAGELLAEPFLDITERVASRGYEQGLLGLAFAPDHAESGQLFANYTDLGGNTIVARFQTDASDPDRVDPGSESIILRIEQPAGNHNGGMLAFGPDGYLYIGTGDGGGSGDRFGNAQNLDSLLGKMLRIDVSLPLTESYAIPPDNPWLDATWRGKDVLDEIWAVGLRNPWRYSFDRQTGDLWIGDVGQNAYEEINFIPDPTPAALNFGWPIMEASHCYRSSTCDQDQLVLPAAEYGRDGGHCSVTGGYVYRGSETPELDGVYFYGDFCSGVIWTLSAGEGGEWLSAPVLETDLQISSFGEDEMGELYVTDLGGRLYRLGPAK